MRKDTPIAVWQKSKQGLMGTATTVLLYPGRDTMSHVGKINPHMLAKIFFTQEMGDNGEVTCRKIRIGEENRDNHTLNSSAAR